MAMTGRKDREVSITTDGSSFRTGNFVTVHIEVPILMTHDLAI